MKLPTIATVFLLLATAAVAAEKSEITEKSFPSRPGKVVLVDAGPLDLSIRASEIPDIRLRIELVAAALSENQAKAWLEAHRPTIEDTDGQLHITAPDPSGINLFKGVLVTRARIELTLPPNVRPDLSTSSGSLRVDGEFPEAKPLRLRAASGDTELSGWAPEVEARSTSGDIVLRASRAIDKLMARSASGSVELTGGARSVRCDTSSSDIHLSGLLGPVGIATTSGNVVARFDVLFAGDEVRITTGSGRVRVSLPPGSEPAGELATTSGDIRTIFPGQSDPKTTKLTLSGHGPNVFITTRSGRIDLS
jgi:ferric-dicitrate binding protein FerR (iron transport regulator)